MDFEATIRQVQETLTVMAGIQARQAEVLKGHSQWLEDLQLHEQRLREGQKLHEQRTAIFDHKMLEIEDQLNGLIGYLDRRPTK